MSLSLYVHIPFCLKKCFYCSFVVSIGHENKIDRYLKCLDLESQFYRREKIKSVYFGGGTPSHLSALQLKNAIKIIKKNFIFQKKCEWSIEINPEGVEFEKLKVLKDENFNRLSLGVQTFDEKTLKFLGRSHNSKKAEETFYKLKKFNFESINLDLMFSFPNQTQEHLKKDLEKIIFLEPDHVSLYGLTVEKNSRFNDQKIKEQESENQAHFYEVIRTILEQSDFKQYEVSNFSKKGKESQHNLNYWQGGNYIGLGVGAHSHINGRRFWNGSNLFEYMKKVEEKRLPTEGEEVLSSFQQMTETLLFGLRMNQGVDLRLLQRRYGCEITENQRSKIQKFIQEGFLIQEQDCLKATDQGRLVLDELSVHLIE